MRGIIHGSVAACLAVCACFAAQAQQAPPRTVLIVLDGLRPDYVTPERMPRLHALGEAGIVFEKHHSVIPTVTRVNAASIATGVYPGKHGLLGNAVYIKEAGENTISTADREALAAAEAATGGNLLRARSMGEYLQEAGKKLVVCSSGSTGSAFLLNHKVSGGAIIHSTYTLPGDLDARVQEVLGPVPPDAVPNTGRNARVTEAVLKLAFAELDADVVIAWYNDPDNTAHAKGMGDALTEQAVREMDAEVGRLLDGLAARGLAERCNIMVTSDHGFSTYSGDQNPYAAINEILRGLRIDTNEVRIAEYALYLSGAAEGRAADIALKLQQQPWVGAVFTRPMAPGVPFGEAAGTLALGALNLECDRMPHLLVFPAWSDDPNAAGFAGTSQIIGVAGHGNTSPWDVHNTLIAAGPAFRKGLKIGTPTCNVDLMPTILYIHRVQVPEGLDGRPIKEALTTGPEPASISVRQEQLRAQVSFAEGGTYIMELQESHAAGARYIDFVKGYRASGGGAVPPLLGGAPRAN